jgi:Tat protein secretion system quality control protein TatD with DNase activity
MNKLRAWYDLQSADIVAIGETGVDQHYQRDEQSLRLQQDLFSLHCDFAQEKKLPVVIHSRAEFS